MPRGRTPDPTNTLKLRGTLRDDRRHADEPTPEICIPKKPAFLKGPAAKVWKELTVQLHNQKLLSEMDTLTLAMLCDAAGEAIELNREIARHKKNVEKTRKAFAEKITEEDEPFVASHSAKFLCTGSKGGLVLNPLIKARAAAREQVVKFGREFGLSPVARTRISTGQADEGNEWLDLMKQNTG